MPVELKSRIAQIAHAAEVRGRTAVSRTCLEIGAAAKRNLVAHGSVVTGNLIGSIEADFNGYDGEVGSSVFYAPFVEFGTGQRGEASEFPGKPAYLSYSEDWQGMTARPYLIPALEAARAPFERSVAGLYR